MSLLPINRDGQLFYGYYNKDADPITISEELLADLQGDKEESKYFNLPDGCFQDWESVIGDKNELKEYSLYMGILVPSMELPSINFVIGQFDSHDMEIVYEREVYIVKLCDDFKFFRPYLTANVSDGEVVASIKYILIKIDPNHRLEMDARQAVSYLLAVVLRMFSFLEGHLEYFYSEHDLNYWDLDIDASSSLERICEVNNFFMGNGNSRIQVLSGIIKVLPELLLKMNDIENINQLFEDCGMEKPNQTELIMNLMRKQAE